MSQPWYKYPRIDDYASYPDPDGAFPKPDSNILVPDGVPITALASGVVSGINAPDGSQPGFGQVVTVKLDTPLNPIADHMAYLHLNQISCSQGQRVTFGTPVGVAGPNPQNAGTGFALYHDAYYGFGRTWAQYVGSPELNPVPFLNSLGDISVQTYGPQSSDFAGWYTVHDQVWQCIETGFIIGHGILAAYQQLSIDGNALPVLGLPTSNEIGWQKNGKTGVVQFFERGCLVYDPAHAEDSQPGFNDVYFGKTDQFLPFKPK